MNTLKAEKRSMDVKAKKLRREGFVTGNVFGRDLESSIPVKMQKSDVERLLKSIHKGSQIMLDVEGKLYNVLIKEVQYNSMAGRVDEIDFQALVSDEKVNSVAEVILENHEKVAEGVLQLLISEIPYKAYPSALVDSVKVDVGHMHVGDSIKVKDLDLAKNEEIELSEDPEAVVAVVSAVHNSVPAQESEESTEE
ncbi:MAG: 50S ribosomal protein L25 [Ruminococcus sp.]|jgi:large subunit ribosomal protein L25